VKSSPAHAILLAAGCGRRLGELGAQTPKCLLRFAGISLLERHLAVLAGAGIAEVSIVVGFRSDAIQAELERIRLKPRVNILFNPRWERGSILSLSCARSVFAQADDALLMDADLLYDAAILTPLLNGSGSALLFDREFDDAGSEAVKVCMRNGRIVEFGKRLAPGLRFDGIGESVGFFRFGSRDAAALAERLEAYADAGRLDEPYEEAVRDLILAESAPFTAHDITGTPWLEIDFPQDVERARREILPRLAAHGSAP
jgi:choline kinase